MLGRILCLRSCVHSKSCVNGELGVQCTWKFVANQTGSKTNPGRVKTMKAAIFMYINARDEQMIYKSNNMLANSNSNVHHYIFCIDRYFH